MTYVCLLRGINVSGKNLVTMAALRDVFAKLGFSDVETYVQSGNVVFSTNQTKDLERTISARLERDLGLALPVVVRDAAALGALLRANPFLKEQGIEPSTLHVTFLSGAPDKGGLARLAAVKAGADRFRPGVRALYLHTPGGYGRSKLSNATIERLLGLVATTRNWRTVTTLCEMAATQPPARGPRSRG